MVGDVKLWLAVGLLACILSVGFLLSLAEKPSRITRANYDKITTGMTMDQVDSLLGKENQWVDMSTNLSCGAHYEDELGYAFIAVDFGRSPHGESFEVLGKYFRQRANSIWDQTRWRLERLYARLRR
jgi:hypothetical protein